MKTNVWKLKNFFYKGSQLDTLYVVTDEGFVPPILPLLYSIHLSLHGTVFELKTNVDLRSKASVASLIEKPISDATICSYIYNLSAFLTYLEGQGKLSPSIGMHGSSICDEKFLNHYLNSVLADSIPCYHSLEVHRSALGAYFNWLCHCGLSSAVNLKLYRKTRQRVAERSTKTPYIQYVTKNNRTLLLNACATLGEKLMMRMGFEVGLRTSEVAGLRLLGKGGLQELFRKLNNSEFAHHHHFPYLLEGRYTKGGVSRWIYFERELLNDMHRYYCVERKALIQNGTEPPTLFFLRNDKRFFGTPIGKEQASRVFRKRSLQAGLNPLLHFHDLRHTFATELFHEELSNPFGRETRSESAALIVVAQRLGHRFMSSGQAPSTTTRYIRMQLQMEQLEIHG